MKKKKTTTNKQTKKKKKQQKNKKKKNKNKKTTTTTIVANNTCIPLCLLKTVFKKEKKMKEVILKLFLSGSPFACATVRNDNTVYVFC